MNCPKSFGLLVVPVVRWFLSILDIYVGGMILVLILIWLILFSVLLIFKWLSDWMFFFRPMGSWVLLFDSLGGMGCHARSLLRSRFNGKMVAWQPIQIFLFGVRSMNGQSIESFCSSGLIGWHGCHAHFLLQVRPVRFPTFFYISRRQCRDIVKRLSWAVVELRPHQNQPGEKPAWGKLPSWKECLKWLCIVVTIWCQWHRGECPTGRKPRGKSSRLNVKCSPRMFNIVARPMGKTADMDGDERDFYGRSMNQFHTMSTSAAGFFLYIKVSKIEIVSITRRFLEPKLSVPNEDHRRRSPHPVHQPGYQECECSMFG